MEVGFLVEVLTCKGPERVYDVNYHSFWFQTDLRVKLSNKFLLNIYNLVVQILVKKTRMPPSI